MNNRPTKFTFTRDHMLLLSHAHVLWLSGEVGAPTIDPKRPYGDIFVISDMAKILGTLPAGNGDFLSGEQERDLLVLHYETREALQILLLHGPEFGTYEKQDEHDNRSWVKVA